MADFHGISRIAPMVSILYLVPVTSNLKPVIGNQ